MANIERKELLSTQDSFITSTGNIVQWIKVNPIKFISAVLIVIFVSGGFSGFYYWKTTHEANALSQYMKAGNNEKMLRSLASEYSSTKAGKISWLKLAEISYEKKKYPEAIKSSKEFVDKWGSKDILYYQGLMLKAVSHMELKETANAIVELDKCIDSGPDIIRQQAMFNKATVLESSGKKAQAIEILKKLSKAEPKSFGETKKDIMKPDENQSKYQELAKATLSKMSHSGGIVVNAE